MVPPCEQRSGIGSVCVARADVEELHRNKTPAHHDLLLEEWETAINPSTHLPPCYFRNVARGTVSRGYPPVLL